MNLVGVNLDGYSARRQSAAKFDDQLLLLAHIALRKCRLATLEEDTKQVIDGVVSLDYGGLVALRIRENGYLKSFRRQFTIRSRSQCGLQTEIDKIRLGYGNAMVYGFEDVNRKFVQEARVIDLNVFRDNLDNVACEEHENKGKDGKPDGTAFFAYNYDDFPKELVIRTYKMLVTDKYMLGLFVAEGLLDESVYAGVA